MPEHGQQLIVIHDLDEIGEKHDVRMVVPGRIGIDRPTPDVELRLWNVQNRARLAQYGVDPRKLAGTDLHARCRILHVLGTFDTPFDVFGHDPVEPGKALQRTGGPPVKRMSERVRIEPWQANPSTVWNGVHRRLPDADNLVGFGHPPPLVAPVPGRIVDRSGMSGVIVERPVAPRQPYARTRGRHLRDTGPATPDRQR